MLTSAQCLALLEEKEEKKRKEKEEKEQRKLNREMNKKKRKEEQKRKAEEQAKKAAQKLAEKEAKQAEKAAKAAAKQAAKQAEKAAKQAEKTAKQAAVSQKRPKPCDQSSNRSTRTKVPKLSSLEHINPTECCACFGLYEDDVGTGCEWLHCCCSQWIHEDCVDDVVHGDDSEEKVCPVCLSAI